MDPDEKNHYKFIYTRNTPFSFRFFGVFVVLAMFASIPLVVLSINQQTNDKSHASVLATSLTPTVAPTLVLANLSVSDPANPSGWAFKSNLQTGNNQYSDKTYTYGTVPAALIGEQYIQPYFASRTYTSDPLVSFSVNEPVIVYVAFDPRASLPSWLSDGTWTDSGMQIANSEPKPFTVYKKNFAAGTVTLGHNSSQTSGVDMYTVIVVPQVIQTSPTVTLSPTISGASISPTITQSASATVTPTNAPGTAYASISLISPAISTNGGNTQPLHSTRLVTIKLYDVNTQHSYTAQDTLTFDGVQSFTNPHFNLGAIPSGTYQLLVDMPGNLQKTLTQANNTNTFQITSGGTIAIPAAKLIPGDIAPIPGTNGQPYGDNVLDIEDYNVLIGCYSDTQTASSCSNVGKTAADLNDDGKVDAIDYNILLRSFATRDGDSLPILSGSGSVTPTLTPVVATQTPTPIPTLIITLTAAPTMTSVPVNAVALTATPATNVVCSSSSNQQCSYTPSCSTSGVMCQCADNNWAGHDKVYECQSGSWHYINDTTQSSQYICTSPCGSY